MLPVLFFLLYQLVRSWKRTMKNLTERRAVYCSAYGYLFLGSVLEEIRE